MWQTAISFLKQACWMYVIIFDQVENKGNTAASPFTVSVDVPTGFELQLPSIPTGWGNLVCASASSSYTCSVTYTNALAAGAALSLSWSAKATTLRTTSATVNVSITP